MKTQLKIKTDIAMKVAVGISTGAVIVAMAMIGLSGSRILKNKITPTGGVETPTKGEISADSATLEFVSSTSSTPDTCTDSDEGIDYTITGITRANGFSLTDHCVTNDELMEYYCRATDEFSSGQVVTSCSAFSSTSTLSCISGRCTSRTYPVCADSDGGMNPSVSGVVRGLANDTSLETTEDRDVCVDSNNLKEFFCISDYSYFYQNNFCRWGCEGGACAPQPICGNRIIEAGEQCENNSDCDISESCLNCACVANCGNGRIDRGEECENDRDCVSSTGTSAISQSCDFNCRCSSSTTAPTTPTLIVTTNDVVVGLGRVLTNYIAALASDGYAAQVVRMDTNDVSACSRDFRPSSLPVPAAYALYVIPGCIEHFNAQYAIILGGHNQIAQIYDRGFYTDDYYADLNGDKLLDIPIGRIPTTMDNSVIPISNYLKRIGTPYHTEKNINRDGKLIGYLMRRTISSYTPVWSGMDSIMFAYNGANCDRSISARPQLCWPVRPNTNNNIIDDSDFLLLGFHGSSLGEQVFVNGSIYAGGNFIYRPSNMENYTKWKNSIILNQACDASRIHNTFNASESIVTTALSLANPPTAYIGGTGTQYGSMENTVSADVCRIDSNVPCLFNRVITEILRDATLGMAFMRGKNDYIDMGYSYQTAHQTLLYGDPTIKIR